MEQNKKLKETFSVFGSKSLRKALKEELIELGIRDNGDCAEYSQNNLLKVYSNGTLTNNLNDTLTGGKKYYLPQDWDKALAAAQDYRAQYFKCINSINVSWTLGKIYKSREETSLSDDILPINNDDNKECKVISWTNKSLNCFEPSTEAEYLEQENKLKVGDYIIFLKDYDGKTKGNVRQITSILPDPYGIGWINYCDGGFRLGGGAYILGKDFRKATPQEIKEATEVKVGDMVVIIRSFETSINKAGQVAKVFERIEDCLFMGGEEPGVRLSDTSCASWEPVSYVRRATPEEIENYQKVTVSGYESEVVDDKIAFGCQKLSKTTLQELHSIAGHVKIQIGDSNITQELLSKLINKL